jgi:mediator of RNA polymerase II transcription subunit 31
MEASSSPTTVSPRFTLELEFVLSLSNPHYLQHLATVYPHLFVPSTTSTENDATKFAAYISYLYAYWRTPEYAKFLTHPGAVLNTLKLLQEDQFRRDVVRPDVVELLLRGGQKLQGEKDGEVAVLEARLEGEQVAQESNVDRMDEGAG